MMRLIKDGLYSWYYDPKCPNTMKISSKISGVILHGKQKIPKIIHQTHESFNIKMENYIASSSIININPEYEYKFYDAESRLTFIKNNFGAEIVRAYTKVKHGTYKSDLFRYCVLYIEGGIYIDCKSSSIKPFRDFIPSDADFCTFIDIIPYRLTNGFIMSIPQHPYLKDLIVKVTHNILEEYYGSNPLDVTGPEVLGKLFNSVRGNEYRNIEPGLYTYKSSTINILGRITLKDQYFFNEYMEPLMVRVYSNYMKLKDIPSRYETCWVLGNIYNV
jgi:mannosyltransferase OCH1-like enzyme